MGFFCFCFFWVCVLVVCDYCREKVVEIHYNSVFNEPKSHFSIGINLNENCVFWSLFKEFIWKFLDLNIVDMDTLKLKLISKLGFKQHSASAIGRCVCWGFSFPIFCSGGVFFDHLGSVFFMFDNKFHSVFEKVYNPIRNVDNVDYDKCANTYKIMCTCFNKLHAFVMSITILFINIFASMMSDWRPLGAFSGCWCSWGGASCLWGCIGWALVTQPCTNFSFHEFNVMSISIYFVAILNVGKCFDEFKIVFKLIYNMRVFKRVYKPIYDTSVISDKDSAICYNCSVWNCLTCAIYNTIDFLDFKVKYVHIHYYFIVGGIIVNIVNYRVFNCYYNNCNDEKVFIYIFQYYVVVCNILNCFYKIYTIQCYVDVCNILKLFLTFVDFCQWSLH